MADDLFGKQDNPFGIGGALSGLPAPTPTTAKGAFDLLKAFSMPEVKGIWYHNKRVVLDGYRFVECRFDACDLVVNSDQFSFMRCFVSKDSKMFYGEGPARTIKMFTIPLTSLDTAYPSLTPIRFPDGRISIL